VMMRRHCGLASVMNRVVLAAPVQAPVRRSVTPTPVPQTRALIVKTSAAAVEAAPIGNEQGSEQLQQQTMATVAPADDAALLADTELTELDAAAEQALGWLLSHSEKEQEADLDEMMDYDTLDDGEYSEEVFSAVGAMINGSYSDIRVGDRVVGTVYEVDEAGAYVELGEKASGFVPLAECSFAKLKTVRAKGA
jgi:small subunit ribosomal protein S1